MASSWLMCSWVNSRAGCRRRWRMVNWLAGPNEPPRSCVPDSGVAVGDRVVVDDGAVTA
jgi:hypothetical protein